MHHRAHHCFVSIHTAALQEVMLRRLKADVAAQLPPKRRQVVRLPHPAQGRRVASSNAGSEDEDEEDAGGSAHNTLYYTTPLLHGL